MPGQALRAQHGTGGAQGQDLGMGGGIAQLTGAVTRTGNNMPTRRNNNRPHRYLATVGSGTGLKQGGLHMTGKGAHAL